MTTFARNLLPWDVWVGVGGGGGGGSRPLSKPFLYFDRFQLKMIASPCGNIFALPRATVSLVGAPTYLVVVSFKSTAVTEG